MSGFWSGLGTLLANPEFWKAIAPLGWPVALVIALRMFQPMIAGLLSKDGLTVKVAGMEITVAKAAEQAQKSIADLQTKIVELENAFASKQQDPSVASVTKSENNPRIESTVSEHPGVTNAEDGISSSGKSPPSILWVDDFPINNAFLVEKFRNDGIEITLSLSTKDGMRHLKAKKFDLVLTDLGRKEDGQDNPFAGLHFIKQARSDGYNLPILVYAGQRGLQNKDELLRSGATEVTASPVNVVSFVSNHVSKQ